jgi:hypothetical protein
MGGGVGRYEPSKAPCSVGPPVRSQSRVFRLSSTDWSDVCAAPVMPEWWISGMSSVSSSTLCALDNNVVRLACAGGKPKLLPRYTTSSCKALMSVFSSSRRDRSCAKMPYWRVPLEDWWCDWCVAFSLFVHFLTSDLQLHLVLHVLQR